MTREQLKDAVVAAAREFLKAPAGNQSTAAKYAAIGSALAALDAHPAQEVVTLGLMRGRMSDRWHASQEPEQEDPRDWQHVANISFVPPPKPTIPTISATVTREGGR